MNDGEYPSPHATPLGAVAACVTPDFQEGLLGEVLGRLALTHHPVCEREGGAAVTIVQSGERLGVGRFDERDQILVCENQILSPPVRHTQILRQPQGPGSILFSDPGAEWAK